MQNEGAEQCGFCNPRFIMNVFAMLHEIKEPTEEQIEVISCRKICADVPGLFLRQQVSSSF